MAIAFISQFASGLNSAVGSLLRPERLITPSTPSRADVGDVADVRHHELDPVLNEASGSSPK